MARVRRLRPAEVLPLRQRVLRPHQAPEDCAYPGDAGPLARHVGVHRGKTLIAIGSIFPEPEPTGRAPGAEWRIRGMAVAPEARGEGAGGAVLDALVAHATGAGGTEVWCNARTTAAGFYAHAGFVVRGEPFELPHIGPHVVMTCPLAPRDDATPRRSPAA